MMTASSVPLSTFIEAYGKHVKCGHASLHHYRRVQIARIDQQPGNDKLIGIDRVLDALLHVQI